MTSKRSLPGQKVLLCGLDCKPGQEDLFPTDGPPDPAGGDERDQMAGGLGKDEEARKLKTCLKAIERWRPELSEELGG